MFQSNQGQEPGMPANPAQAEPAVAQPAPRAAPQAVNQNAALTYGAAGAAGSLVVYGGLAYLTHGVTPWGMLKTMLRALLNLTVILFFYGSAAFTVGYGIKTGISRLFGNNAGDAAQRPLQNLQQAAPVIEILEEEEVQLPAQERSFSLEELAAQDEEEDEDYEPSSSDSEGEEEDEEEAEVRLSEEVLPARNSRDVLLGDLNERLGVRRTSEFSIRGSELPFIGSTIAHQARPGTFLGGLLIDREPEAVLPKLPLEGLPAKRYGRP